DMKKRQPVEEMVRVVREAEALLAQGKPIDEVCRQLGMTDSTLVRWRHKYGGLSTPDAKRLKVLEKENTELKHIVAELELDKRILKTTVTLLGKA
ncbi:MAG: transposase, partial [bacterium]